MVETRWI